MIYEGLLDYRPQYELPATYGLRCTVVPTEEPVSLAEAKQQVRVEHNIDDALIAALIAAARSYCETFTRRRFCTATWVQTLERFPDCSTRRRGGKLPQIHALPASPVQSVTGIVYVDEAGDTQTLAASAYQVDVTTEPACIIPAYGTDWPIVRRQLAAVTITFVAGYGAASAVPPSIKAAIRLIVGFLYANREMVVETAVLNVPFQLPGVAWLLWPHVLGGYA